LWVALSQGVEGFAAVKRGKKWGFIEKSGQMVIAPQFDMQQCGFKRN